MADNPHIPSSSGVAQTITAFRTVHLPKIDRPQFVINAEQGTASEFHKRLIKWIRDFDARLDDTHEVGIRLVNFGQTVTFHLESLGYCNPYLISFAGHTDDGNPVELIQHVNQISVLLMKIARVDPTKPKRTIGFQRPEVKNENGA